MKLVAKALEKLADAVNNLAKVVAETRSLDAVQLRTHDPLEYKLYTDLQPVAEATQEEQDLPYFEDIMEGLVGSSASIVSVEDENGDIIVLPAGTTGINYYAGKLFDPETIREIALPTAEASKAMAHIGIGPDGNPYAIPFGLPEFQVGFAGPAQELETGDGPYEVKF